MSWGQKNTARPFGHLEPRWGRSGGPRRAAGDAPLEVLHGRHRIAVDGGLVQGPQHQVEVRRITDEVAVGRGAGQPHTPARFSPTLPHSAACKASPQAPQWHMSVNLRQRSTIPDNRMSFWRWGSEKSNGANLPFVKKGFVRAAEV